MVPKHKSLISLPKFLIVLLLCVLLPVSLSAQRMGGTKGSTGGGSGTITAVNAGTGLTGGGTTGAVTLSLTLPVALANGGTNSTTPCSTSGGVMRYTGTAMVCDSSATLDGSGKLTIKQIVMNGVGTAAITFPTGTAPSNPTTGNILIYADTTTGQLTCLNSTGGNCLSNGGSSVTSVFGRTGAVVATAGDYTAAQVTNAVDKSAANTGGASMTLDMSASSVLKVPASAGAAPTASAQIAYDTTANNWIVGKNGSSFTLCTSAGEAGCGGGSGESPITGGYLEIGQGGGSTVSAFGTNVTKCWLVIPDHPVTTTHIMYNVSTIDNSADLYDFGFYSNTGTLLGHIGATAGTTVSPTTGMKSIAWLAPFTLQPNTRYWFCTTGNASTLVLSALGNVMTIGTQTPSAGNTTTGGALNASITPAADAPASAFGNLPHILVY